MWGDMNSPTGDNVLVTANDNDAPEDDTITITVTGVPSFQDLMPIPDVPNVSDQDSITLVATATPTGAPT